MANNVKVGIIIDDKGTLKKVTNDTKKAGAAADNYSKKQKGVAGATSNSTKAFSKMSQGMGGVLVPAYAAFAAQMFALTAAFGFFRRAGDLKTLQAGQLAYASGTGIAMKSMTKDIMEATGAQIAFRDASQATAIGTAAGVNADQLTRLGKAAKDASAVLGRDVTDSFNRLVRGVTKAEPELLDELGIILRLDTATQKYGDSIGKAKDDLTAFERTQAVVNEVLEQSESKYSRILDLTGGGTVNKFAQLGVALDEVVMKIQKGLIPVAEALAKVLTDLPLLAGAGFALLLTGPIKAMGFSLADVAAKTKISSDIQQAEYLKIKATIDAAAVSQESFRRSAATVGVKAQQVTGKGSTLLNQVSSGTNLSARDSATFMRATNAALKEGASKNGIVIKGIYKGVAVSVVTDMKIAYKKVQVAGDITEAKSVKNTTLMRAGYLRLSLAVKQFGVAALTVGARLLSIAGWLGIVVTGAVTLYNIFKNEKPIDDAAAALDRYREKIKDLNSEFKLFLETQKILTEGGGGGMALGAAIGNLVGSAGPAAMTQALKDANEGKATLARAKLEQEALQGASKYGVSGSSDSYNSLTKEQTQGLAFIQTQIDTLDYFKEKFGEFKEFENYRIALVDGASIEDTIKAKNAAAALGSVFASLPGLAKNSEASIRSFTNSLSPLNQAESALLDIEKEKAAFALLGASGKLSSENVKKLISLHKEKLFIEKINDRKHESAKIDMESARGLAAAQALIHPVTKGIAVQQAKIVKNNNEQKKLADELSELLIKQGKASRVINDSNAKRVEILGLEQAALEQAGNLLAEELNRKLQLEQIERSLFELKANQKLVNVSKQLLDFDKESLSIAKRREAITKAEGARAVKAASRGPGFGGLVQNSSYVQAKSAASVASDGLSQTETDIKADFALRKKLQEEDNKLQQFKMQILMMEMQKLKIERETLAQEFRLQAAKEPAGPARQNLMDQANDISSVMFGDQVMDNVLGSIKTIIAALPERGTAIIELLKAEETEALTAAKQVVTDLVTKAADLEPLTAGLKDLGDSVYQSMSGAFQAIVTGTQSAKQAFSSMAMSILADLSSMIAKQLVFSMFQGSGFGNFMGIPGARTGGIMSDGEKVSGYATGGVARGPGAGYPAVLHGTEAVVPLPNGRSIPVEMQGGGGSQNNIVVNVSTDGQTSNSGSTGPDMDKLGGAIAEAVQKELHAQKRSGGILNPYGVA
tara:strand:+ start:695 stop:4351 length:3657 start_codon:yes stop_codon:yes gene_type:complete